LNTARFRSKTGGNVEYGSNYGLCAQSILLAITFAKLDMMQKRCPGAHTSAPTQKAASEQRRGVLQGVVSSARRSAEREVQQGAVSSARKTY